MRVTLGIHFIAAGEAGDQIGEFDLDSQPQVILIIVPVFFRHSNASMAKELLEIVEHGGVGFARRVRPFMKGQVLRGKVGEDPGLVQENNPRDQSLREGIGTSGAIPPLGASGRPSSVEKRLELEAGSSSRPGAARAVPGRGR